MHGDEHEQTESICLIRTQRYTSAPRPLLVVSVSVHSCILCHRCDVLLLSSKSLVWPLANDQRPTTIDQQQIKFSKSPQGRQGLAGASQSSSASSGSDSASSRKFRSPNFTCNEHKHAANAAGTAQRLPLGHPHLLCCPCSCSRSLTWPHNNA